MIDRAWEWAKKQLPAGSRFRTNSVHGAEEIKVVLSDTFELENLDREETTRSGSIDLQEGTVGLSEMVSLQFR